jgi:hypothetical protein
MTWLGEFEDELAARGVRPAMRERLVAELSDHIACEQAQSPEPVETRLGVAREIAGRCADELGTDDVRHAVSMTFVALSAAAAALVISMVSLNRINRYPGFDHGFSVALSLPAILALLIGPQVALAGGILATWRVIRRRRETVLPGAELALVRRRAQIGATAGLVTSIGVLLYTVNFIGVLPAWWLALSGSLSAGATVALLAARRALAHSSATVVAAGGPAGDLFDDIPPLRALRGRPFALCLGGALTGAFVVTFAEWHAERSLAEGLERGAFEALVLSVGFVLLGRALGARR